MEDDNAVYCDNCGVELTIDSAKRTTGGFRCTACRCITKIVFEHYTDTSPPVASLTRGLRNKAAL